MLRKRVHWRQLTAFGLAVTLGATASSCGDSGSDFTVGSKGFPEQELLGVMTIAVLEDAGYTVDDEIGLQSTQVARDALEGGDIDMYWEYLGTGWIEILGNEESINDKQEQYEAVRDADAENGIVWLEPSDFNNTYAIATSQENADTHDLESVSDIGRLLEDDPDAVSFCAGGEFATRPDGLPGVQETYGFEIPSGKISNVSDQLVYPQIAEGDCTFGSVFATSGPIEQLDLVVLEDEEAAWPLYYGTLTIREDVFEENPELEELFAPIIAALDQETMTALNAEVEVNEREPDEVAEEWLTDNGFIEG